MKVSLKEDDINKKNKKLAYDARDRIYNLVTGKKGDKDTRANIRKSLLADIYLVKLTTYGTDKYGRLLADVNNLCDNKTYSEYLLNENLAYKYDDEIKLKKLSTE